MYSAAAAFYCILDDPKACAAIEALVVPWAGCLLLVCQTNNKLYQHLLRLCQVILMFNIDI